MQLKQHVTGSQVIVYDADRIQQPDACLFEPGYWQASHSVVGKAQGRGNALMLETPFGPAVLRQYLRGGFAASLSKDKYLFLGYAVSRPVAEANVLARLGGLGLPVPEVLGAMCLRQGLVYSGALLTRRIPAAVPLAEVMASHSETELLWRNIGECVRRFHKAGVYHSDLNVRNVLLDEQQKTWLIDFDRARLLEAGSHALASNLQRLRRSLVKEGSLSGPELEQCWRQFMIGYNESGEQGDTRSVEKKA